tara:strand:+ start:323 stop:709 length:387 start_codon:yes stop_codon:yes gene_type:complete
MINEFPPEFKSDLFNLAIDFDGVIHDNNKGYHDGTCYGKPIKGSIEAIKKLSKRFKIIIFTAKAKKDRPEVDGKTGCMLVDEWLQKYKIRKYISLITSEKPRALLYIDDKGHHFKSWEKTLNYVNNKI